MPRESARTKLLAAASRLFYSDGIAATGIDAITAEAGVAKMSLYNNFSSKGDLVLAYVEQRHQELLGFYEARASAADEPRARALAMFDAYLDHAADAAERGFRGCGLLNAAAEFPLGEPARDAVRAHKEEIEAVLQRCLAGVLPPARASEIAELLAFLLEGGTARAGLEADPARLLRARQIAAAMLDAL